MHKARRSFIPAGGYHISEIDQCRVLSSLFPLLLFLFPKIKKLHIGVAVMRGKNESAVPLKNPVYLTKGFQAICCTGYRHNSVKRKYYCIKSLESELKGSGIAFGKTDGK